MGNAVFAAFCVGRFYNTSLRRATVRAVATKQSTKQPQDRILATYVAPDVKEAFEAHCEREHRTIAGELRLLIERRLVEAEQTEEAA